LVQLTLYNAQIQEILCDSELIDQVVSFMKNAKDLKIQAKSIALVGAIVSIPPSAPKQKNKWQTIIRSKISIEQLIQTLSTDIDNDQLQAASLRTIDFLAMNKIEIQNELHQIGAVEKITALLHRGSNVIKEAAAYALRGLTRNFNLRKNTRHIQNSVRESGAIGDLTNMLLSDAQWLHTSALAALSDICYKNSGNQQMVIGAVSPQHIALHIARNREYETQFHAISLIKNLVEHDRARKKVFLQNTDVVQRLDDIVDFSQSMYVRDVAKYLKNRVLHSPLEKVPTEIEIHYL